LGEEAGLFASGGDFKRAVELYDRAAKDAPDNSPLKILRAVALYRAGRIEEADRAFAAMRGTAKTGADFNRLCWNKATAGILLESALADCRKALELEPDSNNIQDSLGFALLRLGRLDESIAAYTKAIARKNGSASLLGRAMAYGRKGDKVRADADRTAALKLDADIESRFAEYGLKFDQSAAAPAH
jgi:Flp pilus assembly protein TadD